MTIGTGDSLRQVADLFQDREVPRVGWPTTVLPPRGVQVTAIEHSGATTIIVTRGSCEGTARLDLETREVAVSAAGPPAADHPTFRRLALEYVVDRNDFEARCGIDTHPTPPSFDEQDPHTWTDMQLLAEVTDSDWYPPPPAERSSSAWAGFYATAHRFNDRTTPQGDAATTPHPDQLRVARSSVGPATPDQQGSAAE